MSQSDFVQMLLRKGAADEALLDQVLASHTVDDDIFGFHCQQAAEKYMKALLSNNRVIFPKTHNLLTLMELLEANGVTLPESLSEIDALTPYATILRYEDISAPESLNRQRAREWVRLLRHFVLKEIKRTDTQA